MCGHIILPRAESGSPVSSSSEIIDFSAILNGFARIFIPVIKSNNKVTNYNSPYILIKIIETFGFIMHLRPHSTILFATFYA